MTFRVFFLEFSPGHIHFGFSWCFDVPGPQERFAGLLEGRGGESLVDLPWGILGKPWAYKARKMLGLWGFHGIFHGIQWDVMGTWMFHGIFHGIQWDI